MRYQAIAGAALVDDIYLFKGEERPPSQSGNVQVAQGRSHYGWWD
jgi:hypothetical protein